MELNKQVTFSLMGVVTLVAAGFCFAPAADAHDWRGREIRREIRLENQMAAQSYYNYVPYYRAPVIYHRHMRVW